MSAARTLEPRQEELEAGPASGPYNDLVTGDDLRRFARRDWATADTGKGDYWAQQYRKHGAAPARQAASALLQHMRAVQPDYPSPELRDEDLADHRSLRQRLDRASHAFTRR